MAARVQTVAVLLIVQGSLEIALGLMLSGAGLMLAAGWTGAPFALRDLPVEGAAAFVVLGPMLLLAGGLKLAFGIRNHSFRGRLGGIVALASGALALPSCCCAPTALGLLAYGLRVYSSPEARRAFQMGEQGLSPEWILASGERRLRP
jgi:hypothetical protein